MKCPNCDYTHGWVSNGTGFGNLIEGSYGDFYKVSNNIVMTRQERYYEDEVREMYGCPACGIIFIQP